MNPTQLVGVIRAKLNEAKAKGFQSITTESVETLVQAMEAHLQAGSMPDVALEEAKLNHASKLAHYTATNVANLELFKSVIETTKILIQSLILINGGSAVALLAFIGHLASSGNGHPSVSSFAAPLLCFVIGVGTAAFFGGLIALAQKLYSHHLRRSGNASVMASILLALASFTAFGLGSYWAYKVFATVNI